MSKSRPSQPSRSTCLSLCWLWRSLRSRPKSFRNPTTKLPFSPPSEFPAKVPGAAFIYIVIALSGLSALGAEVIWTRLLSLLLGGTVYTFSIILAVLLLGLVIGSSIGAMAARLVRNPRLAAGRLPDSSGRRCCLGGAIAGGFIALLANQRSPRIADVLYLFETDLIRCAWAILPATCLWGASFPLALASAARHGADPGRLVGGVYAANTLGAILGALFFSLIGIPFFGTQHAQQILIGICGISGLVAITPKLRIDFFLLKLGLCTVAGWGLNIRGQPDALAARRLWPGHHGR